jgi:Tfp pilus assembly protein FimT
MNAFRQTTDSRGLSVLEVLIVFSIIAVLAGVAVPNLSKQMPKQRLNGATRIVSWALMAARLDAIRQKRNVKFTVTGTYTYKIWKDADKDGNEDSNEIEVINLQNRYYDVNISSTKSPIFNSTGAVIDPPSTDQPITLSNSSGSKSITISSSGLVRVN